MKSDLRVLLVDDNPAVLEPVGSRLRALGYRTTAAQDGAQALEILRRDPPDLLVVDVMMPEVNGYQVCRDSRKLGLNIPIIILTAKSDAAARFWALDCGANEFLTKPIDPNVVVQRIVALLEPP